MMVSLRAHHGARGLHDLAGTFAGLMDLYERNYIGMRRLVPVVPPEGTRMISSVPGGLDLHLRVVHRFKFTSELALSYLFRRDGVLVSEPDLHLRVYHDARQAEVMSAHLRSWPGFPEDRDQSFGRHLRTRWRANRFLLKWLSYCARQGHGFRGADEGGRGRLYATRRVDGADLRS